MPVIIQPGETKVVLHEVGSPQGPAALCVYASQDESGDDGGSQSPIGLIEFGPAGSGVVAEFDIKDGTTLSLPAAGFTLRVWNRNEALEPAIRVSAFVTASPSKARNTRSYDLDPQNPNIRVPPFAQAVSFEPGDRNTPYVAQMSDSATGDTYGNVPANTVYPLHHRARWIRFFDRPFPGGILTFHLSI